MWLKNNQIVLRRFNKFEVDGHFVSSLLEMWKNLKATSLNFLPCELIFFRFELQ